MAFVRGDDGSLVERRGVGGLVTAVTGALRGRAATWVAAALTPGDRDQASEAVTGEDDLLVRMIAPDEDAYDRYYNGFSNRVLWFLSHDLWDEPPVFGDEEHAMFEAYRSVNDAFAEAMATEAGAGGILLPQDYHLALVPGALRARDAGPIAFFWHIPFCTPEQIRVLPQEWARELLRGILGADLVGFHVERWAERFRACCAQVLGARIEDGSVHLDGRTTAVRAFPIGVEANALRSQAMQGRVPDLLADLEEQIAGRRFVLRVDRTEPSKNILRGLQAYSLVLERRPDLRETAWHLVSLTPSRRGVPEYQDYVKRCLDAAEQIKERFGDNVLTIDIADDFEHTLAMFRRYDVLVVNPVADGMNLVAREGPVLNERDGVLVLSANAGAADDLGDASIVIDPFDIDRTALAIEQALDMDTAERRSRAERLQTLAPGATPADWLRDQLNALQSAARR